MHYTLNQVDRHHQTNLTESPAPSLIPKRCACGKAAFAKQLAQHGKCTACQLADRIATLQPDDLHILKWMLGVAQSHRAQWGCRNHYLANRRDLDSLQRLEAAGFVRAGEQILQLRYFHATAAGCKLAGLNNAALRRAMGDRP